MVLAVTTRSPLLELHRVRLRRGLARRVLTGSVLVAGATLLASQACPRELLQRGPAWVPGVAAPPAGPGVGAADAGRAVLSPAAASEQAADDGRQSRRAAAGGCLAALGAVLVWSAGASGAKALVKGNAPPEGYGRGKNNYKDAECKTVDSCEEAGRKRATELFGSTKDKSYSQTASGVRYRDLVAGSKDAGVAKSGSVLQLKYRVMRQGKRSQDGLSGEASTIFSLGYGEDEGEKKDATLNVPVGEGRFVKSLDEGLIGMAVGGKRRIQVRPENGLGWKKDGQCAAAIQAVGIVAGLPNGGAENEETCLDEAKLPQPPDFWARRRFARRFDESLIVEAELVGLGTP